MTTPEKHSTMYRIVSAIIIFASTTMSTFLGLFAELFYILQFQGEDGETTHIGWVAGLFLGLGAAVIYLILIDKKRTCEIFSAHFLMYATLAGTGAGLIAATALHIALMITYQFEPIFLAIGIALGLAAGSTLGIIAAALLKKAYNIKPPANPEPQAMD